MYSIKLVSPHHMKREAYTEPYDGTDGKYTLMNFKSADPRLAERLPVGHQSLVYVTGEQKFVMVIEYFGDVKAGAAAAAAHRPAVPFNPDWSVFRCVRLLARVALEDAPHREAVCAQANIHIPRFCGGGIRYLTKEKYNALYEAFMSLIGK
jgi:hypothetical protein